MQDKLRLAVIGAGSVVREIYSHLYFSSDFTPMLDIVAVAEMSPVALNDFCDKFKIPADRRFTDYREMLEKVKGIDAVQVNTPDHFHKAPAIAALEKGYDVLVPKPTAGTVKDSWAMIKKARESGRLMGIDFHKREDPRIKECAARYQSGLYGKFQVATWYMLDKLLVADPNHQPRFFASPDFAVKNTPISFLTVHMADAFMTIIRETPVKARARGFSQKLPSLSPIAVDGYDLVDTEVVFEGGGVAHIVTGWHLPNHAYANTVQDSRLICTDGFVDLGIGQPGYYELTHEGIKEVNPLFKNFEADGNVSGYGIRSPGRLLEKFLKSRNGQLAAPAREAMMTDIELGLHTSVVLEGAEKSLHLGKKNANGVTEGVEIDLVALLKNEAGS